MLSMHVSSSSLFSASSGPLTVLHCLCRTSSCGLPCLTWPLHSYASHPLHYWEPGSERKTQKLDVNQSSRRPEDKSKSLDTLSCLTSSFFTDLRLARRSSEPLCFEPRRALIISSAETLTFLRAGFLNLPPRSWTFSFSSLIWNKTRYRKHKC